MHAHSSAQLRDPTVLASLQGQPQPCDLILQPAYPVIRAFLGRWPDRAYEWLNHESNSAQSRRVRAAAAHMPLSWECRGAMGPLMTWTSSANTRACARAAQGPASRVELLLLLLLLRLRGWTCGPAQHRSVARARRLCQRLVSI